MHMQQTQHRMFESSLDVALLVKFQASTLVAICVDIQH